MTTETGTVKWFNEGKGFGFITPDSVRSEAGPEGPASVEHPRRHLTGARDPGNGVC